MNKFYFHPEIFQLRLIHHKVSESNDLHIESISNATIANRTFTLVQAKTKIIEQPAYQSEPSTISILYEHVPDVIELQPQQTSIELTWITLVDSNSSNFGQLLDQLYGNTAELLPQHTNEWHQFWQRNEITVYGDEELSKALTASLYGLACSLPSLNTSRPRTTYYGLSPSGMGLDVAQETYKGHSFWDTETWMYPVILLLEPFWSEELLNYRYAMRKAAYDMAVETGYNGYR